MIKDFERGIISFSDYLAEINVLDKYKEKYSWVKSIIIYHIPYSNVTYYDNYLPAKFAYSTDYHKVINEFLEEEAKKYDIPLVENKPLARMLYHNVDLDEEIPEELYQILRFVQYDKNKLYYNSSFREYT